MRLVGLGVLLVMAACGGSKGTSDTTSGAAGESNGSSAGTSGIASAASSGSGSGVTVSSTSGAIAASSGGATGGSGATSGSGSTSSGFVQAKHAPFPQIPNGGGGVIGSPKLVTITFPNENYDVSGFADWMVGSDYLAAVGKDYGVRAGTHIANYVSTDPVASSIDDSDIQSFLTTNAGSAFPAPDSDTIYLLTYPYGTSISNATVGGKSCNDFYGYHYYFNGGGKTFTYAVVPTCDAGESEMGFSWSVIASHEVMEAATDPTGSSWDLSGGVWTLLGTEVGDLCEGQYFQSDAGYLVQRIWSNSAAALGNTSPCIPFPEGDTYFNLSAEAQSGASGDFSADVPSSSSPQTVIFSLTPWSTAPVNFSLGLNLAEGSVSAVNIPTQNNQPPVLQNGVPQTMKITIPGGASNTDIGIMLKSSSDNYQTQNLAPLLIHVH